MKFSTLSFLCQELFSSFFKLFQFPHSQVFRCACRLATASIDYHIIRFLSTPFFKFFNSTLLTRTVGSISPLPGGSDLHILPEPTHFVNGFFRGFSFSIFLCCVSTLSALRHGSGCGILMAIPYILYIRNAPRRSHHAHQDPRLSPCPCGVGG